MYYILLLEKLCSEFAQNAIFARFCYYFSFLFSGELFVVVYSVAAVIWALIVFTYKGQDKYKVYNDVFDFFSKLGFVFFTFVIVYLSAKTFFACPRPNNANDLTSFPSAHSGLACILFCHFYRYFSKLMVVVMCLLITINSVVLLSLRCHYVFDIVWGILLAPITRAVAILTYNLCLKPIQLLKEFVYKRLVCKNDNIDCKR